MEQVNNKYYPDTLPQMEEEVFHLYLWHTWMLVPGIKLDSSGGKVSTLATEYTIASNQQRLW